MKRRAVMTALGVALTVIAAPARASDPAIVAMTPTKASWSEIKWPFLTDEWGVGRAFACKATDCGTDVALYLRAKIGFCNCATGVTDDEELDRVGDLPLLSNAFVGLAAGHAVEVDGMSGRGRPYQASLPLWRSQTAVAVVLHAKCDAVVATIVAERDHLAEAEREALGFLSGEQVTRWAKLTLGW